MKLILAVALLTSSFAFGASTTSVPVDAGLKQVYITDAFGNGLLDQTNSIPALSVSLGSSVGKSLIGKTGSSLVSATTHMTPLTYTVTTGKTFYITYVEIDAFLRTASATVSGLGQCSLEIPSGTSVASFNMLNATHGSVDRVYLSPAEPIVATAGQVINVSCDPVSSTATVFRGNFGGYEK